MGFDIFHLCPYQTLKKVPQLINAMIREREKKGTVRITKAWRNERQEL